MAQDTPSRRLDQYIVRFPDGMRDTLKQRAADNNRSLNAEIVSRLQESLDRDKMGGVFGIDEAYETRQAAYREIQKKLDALMEALAPPDKKSRK